MYYEIRPEDVNKPVIKAFGRTWLVSSLIGRVLPNDVGKRVYRVGTRKNLLQIENDEQRKLRLS